MKKPKAAPVETPGPALTPSPTFADAIPAAPSAAMVEPYGEANMPRWRRPSLATARYASPRIAAAPTPALTFAGGAAAGYERRRIRYDLVALTDLPDEIRGAQVGQLQANDEIEVLKRQGVWLNVRTPVGVEGWIHRTTLQPIDEAPDMVADETPTPVATAVRSAPDAAARPDIAESIDAEVAMGAFAAATAAAARAHALEAATPSAAVSEAPKAALKRTRTRGPAIPVAPPTPPAKPAPTSKPRSASRRAPSA